MDVCLPGVSHTALYRAVRLIALSLSNNQLYSSCMVWQGQSLSMLHKAPIPPLPRHHFYTNIPDEFKHSGNSAHQQRHTGVGKGKARQITHIH